MIYKPPVVKANGAGRKNVKHRKGRSITLHGSDRVCGWITYVDIVDEEKVGPNKCFCHSYSRDHTTTCGADKE